MSGPTITVFQGGAYQVTFTNEGGCSSTAEADVFDTPEEYLWMFPSGNYISCLNDFRRILGRNEGFYQWQWLKNNVVSEQGSDLVSPYHANPATNMTSGSYKLKLSNGPGACDATSLPMQLTVTSAACKQCINVPSPNVDATVVNTNSLFCSFTATITLANPLPTNLSLIDAMPIGSNFIMGPLSLNGNQLSFTIFPLSPYVVLPSYVIQFSGSLLTTNGVEKCFTTYRIVLPACNPAAYREIKTESGSTKRVQESFVIAPNPAKGAVEISFATQSKSNISVYDLTGRFITQYNATSNNGSWQLPLNTMSAGVYLVVLKENGQVVSQKKLVVE
jgi:hypothetical protein